VYVENDRKGVEEEWSGDEKDASLEDEAVQLMNS